MEIEKSRSQRAFIRFVGDSGEMDRTRGKEADKRRRGHRKLIKFEL